MASVKVVIRGLPFNQRIGCCLQVILITWLLWQPIHCNRNRVIEGNRSTKSSAKQLNRNDFDPLPRPYRPNRANRAPASGTRGLRKQNSSSSNFDSHYNLNYLLSVLQEDERQAIFRNSIINQRSDTSSDSTQTFVSNQKKDNSVPNDIELGVEERKDIQEANKLSLFSSSLNVIDVSPQDTQLAHSVLIVHKPKPNKTLNTLKPTIAPQLLTAYPIRTNTKSKTKSPVISTITEAITTSTTTTESYPTPVRNNHRQPGNRPFFGLRAKPSTTTPAAISVMTTRTTPSLTTIYSENLATDLQSFNTTLSTIEELEELPVIFNNNHKKQSFPMFTRQKLTTTEYTVISTTPESDSTEDKTGFTEVPTVSSTAYTFRPPYMTTIYNHKRPPMKIMTVNANKIKPPDEIFSEGITVLDPPFLSGHPMKLPPNTTIIHKNLIVPMKEGRPKPVYPMSSTTQFPVYPMLGGITSWHTSPTTPWIVPFVTTTAPEKIYEAQQQMTSTASDSSDLVTAQSVNRPTIISGHPHISTQTSGQTSHLVTVTPIVTPIMTPIKTSSSNSFVVTHSAQTPRPSTSTTGYVNAIWAPPMPLARPVQAVQPVSTGWWSPFSNIFSIDPASGSMFSFMNVMKTVMFTILVFFLPPLTLAAALLQTAVG